MKNYDLYSHTPVYTIKELLNFCVNKYGEKEALVYQNRKKDISISFSEFKREVDAFGSYLFHEGFKNTHMGLSH